MTSKDPDDPAFERLHGPGKMVIDGKGNATFSTDGPEGSIRFYLAIQNLNTEIVGKIKLDPTCVEFNVKHRADHTSCQWGGYGNGWDIEEQRSTTGKEIVHADYVTVKSARVSFPKQLKPDATVWFKSRCETTSDGKNVRLQSWLDFTGKGTEWTKGVDATDNGKGEWEDDQDWNTTDAKKCYEQKKGYMTTHTQQNRSEPMLQSQPRMWIRMNASKDAGDIVSNVTLSNITITELAAA